MTDAQTDPARALDALGLSLNALMNARPCIMRDPWGTPQLDPASEGLWTRACSAVLHAIVAQAMVLQLEPGPAVPEDPPVVVFSRSPIFTDVP